MENKYETAKKIFELNKDKKNKYALIFDYLKQEITDMLNQGLQIGTIKNVLMVNLGIDINHSTLQMWMSRRIKKEDKKTKTAKKENKIINNDSSKEKNEDKLKMLKKKVEVFK